MPKLLIAIIYLNLIDMKSITIHFIFPLLVVGILSTLTSCEETHSIDDLVYSEKWLVASETTTINDTTYFFIKQNDSKVWELLGSPISGFNYESGYEYLIAVKNIENNTFKRGEKYSLIKIISSIKKQSEQVPLFNAPKGNTDSVEWLYNAERSNYADISSNEIIVQGDMIYTKEQLEMFTDTKSLLIRDKTKYWPNNVVYYTYGSGFDGQSKVQSAIEEWSDKTSLDFVYGTGKGNYIEFVNDSWNHSAVGMQGGKQQIGLVSGGGSNAGTAMHEIGHAIGLKHEHCRTDRSNKIVLYPENVDPAYLYAFDIAPSSSYATIGTLDFSSIMMYGSYAFSTNGLATMKTPQGGTWYAQRSYLSELDIDGVGAIYGPPFHHMDMDVNVIRDYVSGLDEVYETSTTFVIRIYDDKQFTQTTTLKYSRPITVYKTHTYYVPALGQMKEDVEAYHITIPAGASYYSFGTFRNIERYQMSNPIEIDVTTFSIGQPSKTMFN